MAGRWRMASVQMSFAIMPALVYLFAGVDHRLRRQRDLDRHGRRLHDAADAAAVPDPVAAVGRPRSADLAGAVRAHLRVPRPAGRHRRAPRCAGARRRARRRAPAGRVVSLRIRTRIGRSSDISAEIPAGSTHGARRRDRLGQDHARLSGRASVRARARVREHRRRRHPRHDARLAGRAPSGSSRRRPTCSTPRSARTCASPARRRATRRSKTPRARRRSTS